MQTKCQHGTPLIMGCMLCISDAMSQKRDAAKPSFLQPKYFRHSIIMDINSVLDHVRVSMSFTDTRDKNTKPPKAMINGLQVNVKSLRLQTFAAKGCVCASCGIQASFFALERNSADERRDGPHHLNLYGMLDDTEMLFTHDHILARSLGGKDTLENTQPMCYQCNQIKAIDECVLKEALCKRET